MDLIDKAFLSHSSKDKAIVRDIANELGPLRCDYDEYSFEFILNNEAIRRALSRCSVFVLILSENSVRSDFVQEEIRAALESRASGNIKKVAIFAIDQTSFRALPAWLREINVAQHLRTAKQIARRIDAYLTQLSLEQGKLDDYYLGHSDQEKELSRYLSKPKRNVPVALHIVGHYGVGRKTFLRRSLQALAPRQYTSLIPIDLREYDGAIELYRRLYEYTEISNNIVAGEKFAEFNKMTDKEKSAEIARQIKQLMDADCLLLIIDEGGVDQDIGDYREYFPELLSHLGDVGRPAISFIQTRMMREFYKSKYLRSAHIRVPSLPDDVVYELMCLLLNEFDVEYTEEEARQACSLTDGHPYNIHFIAAYIKGEGIDVALADPAEIIERKFEISQKFIRGIAFSDLEADIVAVLHEYRFCEIEFILLALNRSGAEVVEAVRRLEDFCCLERRDRVLLISPPLRDAIRRDKRFSRDEKWKTEVAERVIKGLESYQAEDNVPLSLIDTAIPELIRTGRSMPFVTALILPSNFLRVARDYYDRRNWTRSAEFCEKALDLDSQLSMDAKVEANRLLGLARTRIDPEDTKNKRRHRFVAKVRDSDGQARRFFYGRF